MLDQVLLIDPLGFWLSWKLRRVGVFGFLLLRRLCRLILFLFWLIFLCWSILWPLWSVLLHIWLLWSLYHFWLALTWAFLLSKESGEVESEGGVLCETELQLVNVVVGEVVGEHLDKGTMKH